MSTDDSDIDQRPTDEEAAAIAAAIVIMRQQIAAAETEAPPPPSRWREAGKRESQRDDSIPL